MNQRAKALIASLQVEQQELGSMISCVNEDTRCLGTCEVLRTQLAELEAAYEGIAIAINSLNNFLGVSHVS